MEGQPPAGTGSGGDQAAGRGVVDPQVAALTRQGGDLGVGIAAHLTDLEIDVLARRCDRLLASGAMPSPRGQWPAIPWPPF